jgi:hypothetical protein
MSSIEDKNPIKSKESFLKILMRKKTIPKTSQLLGLRREAMKNLPDGAKAKWLSL